MYMQNCEELLKYHPLFEALRILGLHRIVLGMHVPPLTLLAREAYIYARMNN